MYIFTQDRRALLYFGNGPYGQLRVTNHMSGGGQRAAIAAEGTAQNSGCIIGFFSNEKAATAELEKIMAALKTGQTVYEVV